LEFVAALEGKGSGIVVFAVVVVAALLDQLIFLYLCFE